MTRWPRRWPRSPKSSRPTGVAACNLRRVATSTTTRSKTTSSLPTRHVRHGAHARPLPRAASPARGSDGERGYALTNVRCARRSPTSYVATALSRSSGSSSPRIHRTSARAMCCACTTSWWRSAVDDPAMILDCGGVVAVFGGTLAVSSGLSVVVARFCAVRGGVFEVRWRCFGGMWRYLVTEGRHVECRWRHLECRWRHTSSCMQYHVAIIAMTATYVAVF
jgi:hypothetical protein